ncbi:MAG TPA: lytic murein transglycosylase, partial [Methylocystis sp.]|nr:lytic murein transglycosylase [Methylocystis sp.]
MMSSARSTLIFTAALFAGLAVSPLAQAAACGNGSAGFDAWKEAFAKEARAAGHSQPAIDALMDTHYNHPTIGADRGQHSFQLSLDEFLAKRGGSIIASKGRSYKQRLAPLFDNIEARYGVP